MTLKSCHQTFKKMISFSHTIQSYIQNGFVLFFLVEELWKGENRFQDYYTARIIPIILHKRTEWRFFLGCPCHNCSQITGQKGERFCVQQLT